MTTLLSKNKKRTLFISLIICFLSLSGKAFVSEENLVRLQGLEGKWQFSIGMNEE